MNSWGQWTCPLLSNMKINKKSIKEFVPYLTSKRLGWYDIFILFISFSVIFWFGVIAITETEYKLIKLASLSLVSLFYIFIYFFDEFNQFEQSKNSHGKTKKIIQDENLAENILELDRRLTKIEVETSSFRMHLFSVTLTITITVAVTLAVIFLKYIIPIVQGAS